MTSNGSHAMMPSRAHIIRVLAPSGAAIDRRLGPAASPKEPRA